MAARSWSPAATFIARAFVAASGAGARIDLFTLDDYLAALDGFQVRTALLEES